MRWNLLAILSSAVLVLFVVTFSTDSTIEQAPAAATSTLAVVTPVTLPPITLPTMAQATSSTKKAAPPAAGGAHSGSSVATSSASTPPAPSGDLAASANSIRAAVVNILCLVPEGGGLESISGSGVIVSGSGFILTNAHVAQYFLLGNRDASCTIRGGSPAAPEYRAALAFISPEWIAANPDVLETYAPMGTGEYDFAVLAIDASASGSALPASFPYVPLGRSAPAQDEQVVIGSYAAQFLQTSAIESALYATIVYGSIKDVFTFTTDTIDVVSLGGSAAAQEGSSGGGVVDSNGDLIATITTSTTQGDTADRNLNAITASYIRREYAAESGSSLDSLLAESPATAISDFAPQIPALESTITANLQN